MTLETFYEHFELLADAPNAVPKLREMVLQLAVRGRLVKSDPFSSPIAFKGSTYPNTGLPSSWLRVSLGDVLDVQNGFAFKSSQFNEVGIGQPLIRIRDILTSSTNTYFDGPFRDEFVVRSGDILVGMDGNFNVARWMGKDALLNQRVCRLQDFASFVDSSFVLYFVKEYLDEINQATTYTTVKHLSSKQVKEIRFPLPPREEQKRIVAKVNELMALCDELEQRQRARAESRARLNTAFLTQLSSATDESSFKRAWERVGSAFDALYSTPETIGDLRKTILQLAVQGKLVRQDPNDEPASRALNSAKTEKQVLISNGSMRMQILGSVPEFDQISKLPEKWEWSYLGDLARFIDYRGKTPSKVASGVRLITAKNVRMGSINLEPQEFVTSETYDEWMTRGFPRLGDVLITTEAPLGNVAEVQMSERFALAQRVINLQPFAGVYSTYLKYCLMSPLLQDALLQRATGMTAQGIKSAKLKFLPIPLPPLKEQKRIVAKVDELMALVDELETGLQKAQANSEQLLEAVISRLLASESKAPVEA